MNKTAMKLLKSSENNNFASFEEGIRTLPQISTEMKHLCPFNVDGTTSLSAFVVRGALELAKGTDSEIGVIRTSEGSYASEWKKKSGETVIATLVRNGEIRVSVVSAAGSFATAGSVGATGDSFDTSSILAMYLCQIMDNPGEVPIIQPLSEGVKNDFEKLSSSLRSGKTDTDVLYRLSDAIKEYFQTQYCRCIIKNGSFPMIPSDSIKAKAFIGELLYGKAEMLMPNVKPGDGNSMTYMQACRLFQREREANLKRFSSSVFLKRMPQFPDDYIVPEEVIEICDSYIYTSDSDNLARNFMIRGITGIGKSKDCELIAALLGLPLFRITCWSKMRTDDFLSNLVPVTKKEFSVTGELPSAADIWMDPEGAYLMMTGEEKEGITPDETLNVYTEIIANRATEKEGEGKFIRVDTDLVRALNLGAICEIQEISRLDNPGEAVGLNEYATPDSLMQLIDGSTIRRHGNAMTVWTDNLGYASCHPVDPSVLRRMRKVIDLTEIDKTKVVDRAMYNTRSFFDRKIVEALFDAWDALRIACQKQGIDDADPSPSDLENLLLELSRTGISKLHREFRWCILNKTTTDTDERENLFNSVVLPKLDIVQQLMQ